MIKDLNASLAERKEQVLAPSAADGDAINAFTKVALETRDRATGRKFGLDYAESFHTLGPIDPWTSTSPVMRCLFNQSMATQN